MKENVLPVINIRKVQTMITRLRLSNTRPTHSYFSGKSDSPECQECDVTQTENLFLMDCPQFNIYRITYKLMM